MKISLIAIGKNMPAWVTLGYAEYEKRLPKDYQLSLIELKESKSSKQIESIPKDDFVIALDVKGELWDTHQLADKLHAWHEDSQNISLLVGGPDGLTPEALDRANLKWSLSPLTLPHPLVRVVVAEQLYRAWSILKNHPYHR